MNLLLFGASGFIGKKVTDLLKRQYHTLITPSSREIDFTCPNGLDLKQIKTLMQNVDVIINMVGVMSQDTILMENVHHHTPAKIAQIAKTQKVKKWVNLSALGANPSHEVAFVGSKGRGDKALLKLADDHFSVNIARPSLVFGRGGASTELFLTLAKMPIIVLPKGGKFAIQPVHVDDVAQGLVNLALTNDDLPKLVNFTGEKVMTLADYLSDLRIYVLHKPKPTIVSMPMGLAKFLASIFQPFSNMISVDSLTLLEQGNTADHHAFQQLLRQPLKNHVTIASKFFAIV